MEYQDFKPAILIVRGEQKEFVIKRPRILRFPTNWWTNPLSYMWCKEHIVYETLRHQYPFSDMVSLANVEPLLLLIPVSRGGETRSVSLDNLLSEDFSTIPKPCGPVTVACVYHVEDSEMHIWEPILEAMKRLTQ